MANYTYDQFDKERQKSGFKFSDADLALAQKYPDAGMSILSAKQQYANAKTAAQKSAANQRAENVRSSYGGYTGGTSGSYYNVNPLSPQSYQDQGFSDKYGKRVDELLSSLYNRPQFQDSYGTQIQNNLDDLNNARYQDRYNYQDRADAALRGLEEAKYQDEYNYRSRTDKALSDLENRKAFRYNAEADPAYQAYRQQYLREGQRATQNAMAQAAMMTGGMPSSYAATAAAQQGNYYAGKLSDKIPELFNQAYDRYMKEYDQKAQAAQLLGQQGERDFSQWDAQVQNKAQAAQLLGQQGQQDFGQWNQQIQNQALSTQMMQDQQNRDWNRYQGEFDMKAKTAQQLADQQSQDYYRYNQDRSFGYGQHMDEVNHQSQLRSEEIQRQQNEFNKALQAYQLGDSRQLEAMGIDTSKDVNRQLQELQVEMQKQQMQTQEYQNQLQKAQAAATYGDYSLLEAMGFDTSRADFRDNLEVAQLIAQYTGDVSQLYGLLKKNSDMSGPESTTSSAPSTVKTGTKKDQSKPDPGYYSVDVPVGEAFRANAQQYRENANGYPTTTDYGRGKNNSNNNDSDSWWDLW